MGWVWAAGAAAAAQFENFRNARTLETINRQKPESMPCQRCGILIPLDQIIIRDGKVVCEKCHEELYAKKRLQ